ncbi:hypothetical protein AKJ45_02795 [candidate division MSBL1 archaeon SCGC-AAA261F19]|uniref:Adenylate kinase n=6 Tax=candidate division MSBL1 TaxID=215777 RepID=A0A133UY24_9EURY|nr:hypothetical protein AKJ42_03760 [candidate division MSBL1 archaeon SCGC-AAA261C02]KXB01156.1 hypothetical protein AKJ44_02880 [candidate division MSBL1 archaeon SCGC-AAA261F17]KXB02569.1 hypothetical protein AKJ43_01550 [candidate division MSBL1 archaeon SCGC-AAA261D19]KXB02927.1 hypothetical protein AKJ47_03125 [candidate division MSBL1 archaeon SCGC-AAA261G05]KXB03035.1 hypothetical protein AKJ45_02795 [candidate division MSBL1 archaeon SCGC-AAA261F19]KXB09115.1 hypothetical protein AKJ4
MDKALEKLREEGVDYQLLNYGDLMLEIAKEEKGVKDRDKMKDIKLETYRDIQKEAAYSIAEVREEIPVLVDTHCTIKKPEGYYPGLPQWVLERLQPEEILIIEALPKEIAGRREKDASRKRKKELEEAISEHQELNRAIATSYAMMVGAGVRIIKNREGKIGEAVQKVVEALK